MGYLIVSTGLFISPAILLAAGYITSALAALISKTYGNSLFISKSHLIPNIIALVLAVLFLIIGSYNNSPTQLF